MVRIKERYLLVNITYPEAEGSRDTATSSLPDLLVYNQPTIDTCTARTVQNAVRTEITNLFGDYGVGSIERTLRGSYLACLRQLLHLPNSELQLLPLHLHSSSLSFLSHCTHTDSHCSQIHVECHLHLHPAMFARPLPPSLGSPYHD